MLSCVETGDFRLVHRPVLVSVTKQYIEPHVEVCITLNSHASEEFGTVIPDRYFGAEG